MLNKIAALRLQIADARQHADVASHDAKAAKVALKKARKAFKLAKRTAKEARKKIKALKEILATATSEVVPAGRPKPTAAASRESSDKRPRKRNVGTKTKSRRSNATPSKKLTSAAHSSAAPATAAPPPEAVSIPPLPASGNVTATGETPPFTASVGP